MLPVLLVKGDKDNSPNFSDLDNWRADAYHQGPGPQNLLTVFDADHIFGGTFNQFFVNNLILNVF